MKVLHLATHDCLGGAARAAYRQHRALLDYGVDSSMLVRHKHSDDPTVSELVGPTGWSSRLGRTLRRQWIEGRQRLLPLVYPNYVGGLSDPRGDLLRGVVPEIGKADVINIHKTDRYVDMPALLRSLPAGKPVVVTLHDLSPITGGCDYPGTCLGFQAECGSCPLLGSTRSRDYSSQIFRMRQAAYSARNALCLAFVSNSHWTAQQCSRSALTQGKRQAVIHYGIDQTVYSPDRRYEARQALGIDQRVRVLAFGAHDLRALHKGGRLLQEALECLPSQESVHLLTMGTGHFRGSPRYRHTHFGMIDCDALQALIYRAADVFIIPSLAEAFGQTALEAISCGTVVAGFKVGGIVDIIEEDVNGRLVESGNVRDLSCAVNQLLDAGPLRNQWKEMAFEWVGKRFSYSKNASEYIRLYKTLLEPSGACPAKSP